jgi:hypothetical protein
MAGPIYTIPQTRARCAALTICCQYITELMPEDPLERKQWEDIRTKLERECLALKEKAQRVRRRSAERQNLR